MAISYDRDGWSSDAPDLRDNGSFREFKKLILRLIGASPEPLSYYGIRQKLVGAGCEPDTYRMQLALEDLETEGKIFADRTCVSITRFSTGTGRRKLMNGPGEWTGRVCQDKRR